MGLVVLSIYMSVVTSSITVITTEINQEATLYGAKVSLGFNVQEQRQRSTTAPASIPLKMPRARAPKSAKENHKQPSNNVNEGLRASTSQNLYAGLYIFNFSKRYC